MKQYMLAPLAAAVATILLSGPAAADTTVTPDAAPTPKQLAAFRRLAVGDLKSVKIRVANVDLNNDGKPDFIAVADDALFCGSAGCAAFAVLAEGSGYGSKNIALPGIQGDVTIRSESHGGMRDLAFSTLRGTAVWRWNGTAYQLSGVQAQGSQPAQGSASMYGTLPRFHTQPLVPPGPTDAGKPVGKHSLSLSQQMNCAGALMMFGSFPTRCGGSGKKRAASLPSPFVIEPTWFDQLHLFIGGIWINDADNTAIIYTSGPLQEYIVMSVYTPEKSARSRVGPDTGGTTKRCLTCATETVEKVGIFPNVVKYYDQYPDQTVESTWTVSGNSMDLKQRTERAQRWTVISRPPGEAHFRRITAAEAPAWLAPRLQQ